MDIEGITIKEVPVMYHIGLTREEILYLVEILGITPYTEERQSMYLGLSRLANMPPPTYNQDEREFLGVIQCGQYP